MILSNNRITRLLRNTEGSHAGRRERALILSVGAAVAARGCTVLTMLVSVPLTLQYLGPDRYGMWLVISSFTMIMSFADMGLGNGLLTRVAQLSGCDDTVAIRRAIASGYACLAGIALLVMLIFGVADRFVDWADLLSVRSALGRAEARSAMFIFVLCFALSIPFGAIQKVQSGLQTGYHSSVWQAGGSLISLITLLMAIWFRAGLPTLVLCLSGGALIANIGNTIVFFFSQGREVRPSARDADWREIKQIAKIGTMFFATQAVIAFSFGFDALIVAKTMGSSSVAQLAVPDRMFAIVGLLSSLILSPLWPAYGEAFARNDRDWILRTFRRAVIATAALVTTMVLPLVLFGPQIVHLWVGPAITPSLGLLIGLALWRVVDAITNCMTTLLNGMAALKVQLIAYAATGVIILPLKLLLVHTQGVAGIPWASAAVVALCVTLPTSLYVRRRLFSHRAGA